ncbi:hypothetical protein OGM23_15710 [Dickeya fangzhongdai]|uniref:hypothetical protein n=1 Tax=Dickeya fangzhongdai TaxID=1778540 RepID=UPI002B2ED995|nr:hypothetical protein OGM23_15710 [Dickeya fangzhongdai]
MALLPGQAVFAPPPAASNVPGSVSARLAVRPQTASVLAPVRKLLAIDMWQCLYVELMLGAVPPRRGKRQWKAREKNASEKND